MKADVLVVEDDGSVRASIAELLRQEGYGVTAVADGRAALHAMAQDRPDLVLLDVMLPEIDGFEVCREIRRTSTVPIIMVSARSDTTDVVVGLELGADDYLTKPFVAEELIARARSALRRVSGSPEHATLRARDLEIHVAAHRVWKGGVEVELTAMEFRLLVELAKARDRVLTREDLLDRVWSYDYLGDSRLVDMAVKRLRAKLGDPPGPPPYIATVPRAGYRFEP